MKITPEDNRVRLENDRGEAITLSPDEVAKLVLHASKILRQLVPLGHDPAKYRPLPTIGAQNLTVSLDAHHTAVILQVEREDGEQIGYLLQPDTVRELWGALDHKIQQIEEAAATKKIQ